MKLPVFPNRKSLPNWIKVIDLALSPDEYWVYYPWHKTAVNVSSEDLFFKFRTDRNRNLITEEEQLKFRNCKVGIAGLSVGSAVLETLVASGGPKVLKLADPDKIELTNLNRMKATLLNVGQNKTFVASHRIWDIDPFAEIYIEEKGLKEDNLGEFLAGDSKLDVFIDEMDDIKMKVLARLACREHGIPVIMATDIGDRVLLDIERFDLNPERNLFHGLSGLPLDEVGSMSKERWVQLATLIIGANNMPKRLSDSIAEVGKTLNGIPQLGSTAALAGAVVTYAVRQIACGGHELNSGRYVINLENLIS